MLKFYPRNFGIKQSRLKDELIILETCVEYAMRISHCVENNLFLFSIILYFLIFSTIYVYDICENPATMRFNHKSNWRESENRHMSPHKKSQIRPNPESWGAQFRTEYVCGLAREVLKFKSERPHLFVREFGAQWKTRLMTQ